VNSLPKTKQQARRIAREFINMYYGSAAGGQERFTATSWSRQNDGE
jgi:hypothetical protein